MRAFIITVFQILVFVILHDFVFSLLIEIRKIGLLNWGISLQIALIEFIVVCLIANLILEYIPKLSRHLVIFIAILLFSLIWARHLVGNTTTLTVKLLGAATIGFLSYFPFSWLYNLASRRFSENLLKD